MAQPIQAGVRIGLSAVVMALRDRQAVVLTTPAEDGGRALPFGPFDPVRDRTFERALRDFVTAQTGFRLGFVEQLYTFGDAGRGASLVVWAIAEGRACAQEVDESLERWSRLPHPVDPDDRGLVLG